MAASADPDPGRAVGETAGELLETMGAGMPLLLLEVNGHHARHLGTIASALETLLSPDTLVGGVADTLSAGGLQMQAGPGLVLIGCDTPGVEPLRMTSRLEGDRARVSGMDPSQLATSHSMLLLADTTFPLVGLLDGLADRQPQLTVGGGAWTRGQWVLDGQVMSRGAVGVVMSGDTGLRTVVGLGASPIGPTWTVTRASGHVVEQLGAEAAFSRMEAACGFQPGQGQPVPAPGVTLAEVTGHLRDGAEEYQLHEITGVRPDTGALELDAVVQVGAAVRFHLADDDEADVRERLVRECSPDASGLVLGTSAAVLPGRGSLAGLGAPVQIATTSSGPRAFRDALVICELGAPN